MSPVIYAPAHAPDSSFFEACAAGGVADFLARMFEPRRDFTLARWFFARLLGIIFLCAFVSLAVQIRGLAGTRGIVPAQPWLDAVWNQLDLGALWQVPTLCWMNAGDSMLMGLCLLGIVLSAMLIWGECFPGLCTLLLWAIYLSLCSVTNPFLGFQWDALLLETALLAALWLPWRWKPDWRQASLRGSIGRWLLWWLIFRLMFESGVVKLASGDHNWSSLRALSFHFETQPLPLPTAWLAHQTPELLLAFATGIMFLIEFLAPVLIVAPRRWRHGAAWALIALQLLIAGTGNYAFFNLLTVALCIPLFDNAAWPARWRARFETVPAGPPPALVPPWKMWTASATLGFVFLLTVHPLLALLGMGEDRPAPLTALQRFVAPFMSFNGYGLFAVMTTSRREIVIEGSNDGTHWQVYEFPWKPGDVNRRPGIVAPHQPRLDWQMWFAALSPLERNPWFVQFLVRLLEGSPEVLGLLEENPFPDQPPRYVRALFYDYHFTRFGEDHSAWWKRELLGLYCPPITLKDGQPTVVEFRNAGAKDPR